MCKKIQVKCAQCHTELELSTSVYNHGIRNRTGNFFCNPRCSSNFFTTKLVPLVCDECGCKFERREKDHNRKPAGGGVYCSRSCAAIRNNRLKPRKSKSDGYGLCKRCLKNPAVGKKGRYCGDCIQCNTAIKLGQMPKLEVSRRSIAGNARTVMGCHKRECEVCGYSKQVEVCHIKAVKDFPDTALVSEINSRDNLKYLCPNCHWELDHPDCLC
jgi:hypothetical protein